MLVSFIEDTTVTGIFRKRVRQSTVKLEESILACEEKEDEAARTLVITFDFKS